MKKLISAILILTLLFAVTAVFASCGNESTTEPTTSTDNANVAENPAATILRWQKTYTAGDFGIRSKKNPFVEFAFSTGDSIRLELYPTVAPISVDNFITYVKEGFYEGTAFHRIIEGQMIQGGGFTIKNDAYVHKDPTHDPIKGEFAKNGVNNALAHTAGVLSMARTTVYDSATSQFFICSGSVPSWNGSYAAFGRVIDKESMAAVSRFEKLETHSEDIYYGDTASSSSDVPITRVTIKKAVLVWDKE